MTRHSAAFALAAVLSFLSIGTQAGADTRVYVKIGPPHAVVETRIATPGPHYVWIDGFHRWDGKAYVWVPGRWDLPPVGRAAWVPGHWAHHHRHGWYWVEGYWR